MLRFLWADFAFPDGATARGLAHLPEEIEALLKELSASEYRSDMGALWENWVVSELAKWNLLKGQPYNLYFWRTTNGSEVDLIIKGTDFFRAYEIKWTKLKSPHHPSFTQRYGIEVEGITRDNFISHSPFASL
jgi:predicted AAA+ superfamily ATPase